LALSTLKIENTQNGAAGCICSRDIKYKFYGTAGTKLVTTTTEANRTTTDCVLGFEYRNDSQQQPMQPPRSPIRTKKAAPTNQGGLSKYYHWS